MSNLDPPSHKKGVLGFGGGLESSPQAEKITHNDILNEENIILALIDAKKAERTTSSNSEKLYKLLESYMGDNKTDGDSQSLPSVNTPPVSQLDSLILDAESKGYTVTFDEYNPLAHSSNFAQAPAGNPNPNSTKTNFKEIFKKNKKPKAIIGASAVLMCGFVFANNQFEDGLLAHIPFISSYFEKQAPPSTAELIATSEALARKTTIEKPLFSEPVAISSAQAPATEPELSLPINYSTTSSDGQELTLANGVRMAAVNPYLQVNYNYNSQKLQQGLSYNQETQTVSVPAEAINLQFLLLAPPQPNQAVNGKTPQFAYRIAGSVGENEAIKDLIKEQNDDFAAKDIKLVMDQLANPANETAISMQITQDTFKQLLADPEFLQAINNKLSQQFQNDISALNPRLKGEPIQFTKEFITSLNDSFASSYESSPLSEGLSLGSNINGLNPPQQIN
jgi:NACalpha-BTF3-like transcription factor